MPRLSLFTHDFLLLMAGPVVWAVHFVAIYGLTGVVCARPDLPRSLVTWGVAAMSVAAVAALVAICLWLRPRVADAQASRFQRQLGIGLVALSILAIVWETLPLVLAPVCSL